MVLLQCSAMFGEWCDVGVTLLFHQECHTSDTLLS